ncbi:43565_t:CDS:2 [Gigaspora margarita]|uniref:43565_t:CDS:1 n=1 Tax=Gigaspora margarita TaxID=4874 RepID=A0ABN7VW10_GIGMA|nr:43565_t:CDS:2 [Gigaspora margarita]
MSATTITRPNKRKQQLKATRAKKKSHVSHDYEDYEDLVWSDQDIDDRASNYFAVLLTASKNWKPSSRPSTYVGSSKRTKRHKKVELKKAAQDTQLITTYFAPTLTCESELEPLLLEYDDKDLTILIKKDIPPEEKQYCVITHDKTTLSANDNEKME